MPLQAPLIREKVSFFYDSFYLYKRVYRFYFSARETDTLDSLVEEHSGDYEMIHDYFRSIKLISRDQESYLSIFKGKKFYVIQVTCVGKHSQSLLEDLNKLWA